MPKDAGSDPVAHPGTGGRGEGAKVTRKNFACIGAKEIVCSAAPPPVRVRTFRNVWPSSLASSVLIGGRHSVKRSLQFARVLSDPGDGPNGLRRRIFKLNPGDRSSSRNRQLRGFGQIAIAEQYR